jgi:hypothetical protein
VRTKVVEVMRGCHGQEALLGPLPGARLGQVVAYEFELPDSFEPWPGRTLVERTFVLLDLDVMVPIDGRHYRILDLDEFADAIDDGTLSVEQAADALRRCDGPPRAVSSRVGHAQVVLGAWHWFVSSRNAPARVTSSPQAAPAQVDR